MTVPALPPKLQPYRCSQHVAFHAGTARHVVVEHGPDGDQVLIAQPGRETPHGIYSPWFAADVAEKLADLLTKPKAEAA